MLGIVYTTLIEMLEEKISPEFADEVLQEANLDSGGSFTAVGYYPFEEMQTILSILVSKTGQKAEDLLYQFGEYLFGKLAEGHPQVLIGRESVLDILETLDADIHVQVRKLYSNAELPRFTVLQRTNKTILLRYESKRELPHLAMGLIHSAANHLGDKVHCDVKALPEPHCYELLVSVD